MGFLLRMSNITPERLRLSTVDRSIEASFMESRSCWLPAFRKASLRRISWSSGLYLGEVRCSVSE